MDGPAAWTFWSGGRERTWFGAGLGDSWELGLTGRYATGRPYTPILGRAPSTPERPLAPRYGPPLSARYPDYRRLDARLTRFVPLPERSLVLYLEGLNLLGRQYVVGYAYDAEYRSPEPVRAFFSERTLVRCRGRTFQLKRIRERRRRPSWSGPAGAFHEDEM